MIVTSAKKEESAERKEESAEKKEGLYDPFKNTTTLTVTVYFTLQGLDLVQQEYDRSPSPSRDPLSDLRRYFTLVNQNGSESGKPLGFDKDLMVFLR
jgi:hypothetical protein